LFVDHNFVITNVGQSSVVETRIFA